MRGSSLCRFPTLRCCDCHGHSCPRLETRYGKTKTTLFLVALLAVFAAGPPVYAQDGLYHDASLVYENVRASASQRGALITAGADYDRVESITHRLIAVAPEMRSDAGRWAWDVIYIRTPKANAYCFPGGKIIVTSSLVDRLALTDDELAAVIGHEMGHALLEHGKEAYEQRQVAKAAVGVLGIIAAIAGVKHHTDPTLAFNATTAVGSLGAEFLALRPYDRERELAADKYGAELAARAGFDPRGAISLQRKLSTEGTIEFLSTHPLSETRVSQLSEVVPGLTQRFAARREPHTMIAGAMSTNGALPASVPVVPPVAPPTATSPGTVTAAAPQTKAVETGREADANALVQPGPAMSPRADDPDVITGAAAASMTSKYMFSAERYAKARGCAPPSATMIVRAPSYESFDIKCGSSSHMLVRCEYGNCAVAAE